jgi:SanA protein
MMLLVLSVFFLGLARLSTLLFAKPRIFSIDKVPTRRIAIVFGAGLRRDGTPQPVLRDRVKTAALLYLQGKVDKLLMSGSTARYYDEPGAMKEYAIQLGIPKKDIVLDNAGHSTYETCYRAKEIFKVDSATLITQGFHLPRAIYTCNALGIDAIGVPADLRIYRKSSQLFWNLRETLATLNALWEVHLNRPLPVPGDPQPIITKETIHG